MIFTNNVNFTNHQAKNIIIDNVNAFPSNPLLGQQVFKADAGDQRMYYWSGDIGVNNGAGWIKWEPPTTSSGVTGFVNTTSTITGGIKLTDTIQTTTGDVSSTKDFIGTPLEVTVTSPANGQIQIGLPDDVTISNNLIVSGNLYVNGTETIINTDELKVEDNIITLNSNVTGTPIKNAGIEVERGDQPDTSVIWNEASKRWTFTNDGSTYYNIPISSDYNNYVHPSYSPINVDGSGLQFVQDVVVDNLGHTTSVVLGTIPNATTTTYGVVRKPTAAELVASNTENVPSVSDVYTILNSATTAGSYKTTLSASGNVTHNLGTRDVRVETFDNVTGETVYTDVIRTDDNTINIAFTNYPNPIRVLITRV